MKTGCRLAGLLLFFMLTLAPAAGWSVVVSSVGALQSAVDNANSGGDKTILIADGVYDLSGVALFITMDGVTVRSASGNRRGVVLDSHYVEGGTSGIFRIVASSVTIAECQCLSAPSQRKGGNMRGQNLGWKVLLGGL